ncbi:MAG: hydrogenase expression protein HupH [Firmicutes bacterium]|jgi:allantoin racemase|nr:hydrogenase expression protein HupH [Bacillota bacterium]
MKVKIIVPIALKSFRINAKREYEHFISKGRMFKDFTYDVEILEEGEGPLTIESQYDSSMAEFGSISLVEKAEREGYDGVVIDCFCDAGYHASREVVNIPVVGAFETSIRFAQLLGDRIGIVALGDNRFPSMRRRARAMGAEDSIVSISSVDMGVAELGSYKNRLIDGLEASMIGAIENDAAEVLILGCTGMMGVAMAVQNRLKQKGYDVPVVNPAETCLRFMECLLVMGIKQSRMAYPMKSKKR